MAQPLLDHHHRVVALGALLIDMKRVMCSDVGFHPRCNISLLCLQLRLLCQLDNSVEVTVLPPYVPSTAERTDPRLFATNVRALYSKTLGLPLVNQSQHEFRCDAVCMQLLVLICASATTQRGQQGWSACDDGWSSCRGPPGGARCHWVLCQPHSRTKSTAQGCIDIMDTDCIIILYLVKV